MGGKEDRQKDSAEKTVREIRKSSKRDRKEDYLGFPEWLFARLNGIWPSLVDTATRAQNRIARTFAER